MSSQKTTRPVRDAAAGERFVAENPGWTIATEGLEKTYPFTEYAAALAFALRVGMAADKRDHHPELHISWGKVKVRWTTHDAGGITALDLEMARVSDLAWGG
jgi:4a-hydroxytetrahydrobiopterin dehydratase